MPLPDDQFDRLLLAEADAMYRMARRLTRTADRAEDLVQETVARALRSRSSFDLQTFGIKPWLLRIMYNLHVSRAGRERRQPAATEPESLDAAAQTEPGGVGFLPISPSDFQSMDEQLVHALDELPPESRATLLLWAVEGLSYKEIALALDVPIGTVMSRLHRARQRLAEQLRPYAEANRLVPTSARE
jgi:RNA polymerase sigma-70 factor (ECF subfamily)